MTGRGTMFRVRGFSLIELVVAIAIIGLLAAIAFPSFQTWLRNLQVRNAAEALQNGLQLARMEALRRNERVSFWAVATANPRLLDDNCMRSGNGGSWLVSRDDPTAACGVDPSESAAPRIIQKKAGGDGAPDVVVAITDAGGNAASCASFNGFGRVEAACADAAASSPLARIVFSSAQADPNVRKLEVRLTAGGLIRMCDPAVAAASDPRFC